LNVTAIQIQFFGDLIIGYELLRLNQQTYLLLYKKETTTNQVSDWFLSSYG